MTTLNDVARRASVSPSTVSLVLREAGMVKPSTRRRVESAIGELGYRPRGRGRPAKSGTKKFNIAVAYPGAAVHQDGPDGYKPVTRRWFEAIHEELSGRGHHLSFFGGQFEGELDPLFTAVVQRGGVNGAIFIPEATQPRHMAWTTAQGVPALAINRHPEHDEFSYLEVDNFGGCRAVVDHLAARHHQRIAMVYSPNKPAGRREISQTRREGFEHAMCARGLMPAVWELDNVEPDEHALEGIARRALDAGVTAMFCEGDHLVVRLADILERLGVDVPGQMSMVGVDAAGLTTRTGLLPTSLAFDSQVIAQRCADLILQLMQQRDSLIQLNARIRTHVLERDTVADAPPDADRRASA